MDSIWCRSWPLLILIAVSACSKADVVLQSGEIFCIENAVTTSSAAPLTVPGPEDDVYWDEDGVMEFWGDDGNLYKLEREGPYYEPGGVTIWRNGEFMGWVDFFGSEPTPELYRWEDYEWAETDDQAVLLDTSAGMPGGGGGDPCDPGDPDCVEPDGIGGFSVLEFGGNGECDTEVDEFRGHASVAIASSIITGGLALIQLATKVPMIHVPRRAATATASAVILSIRSGMELVDCLRRH